jgi:cytochrome c553
MRSLALITAGLLCLNLNAQRNMTIPEVVENDCMGCHANVDRAPMMSGQNREFLEFELFNFRDYVRDHEIMNQVMEDFSDKEVKEIAAYISSLSICDAQAPREVYTGVDVKNGEKIFQASCFNCHSRSPMDIGPVIHGQKAGYLVDAIKSFQSTWYEPRPSRINMRSHTDMLSEQDIKDVASYLNQQKICK